MSIGSDNCGGIQWPSQQLSIMSQSEVNANGFDFTQGGCDWAIQGVQSLTYDANFDLTPFFNFVKANLILLMRAFQL